MAEEKFTFSLGPSGDATVDGWENLLLWLAKERAKWAWLVPGDGRTDAHNWAGNVQNQWNAVVNNVTSMHDQGQPIESARPHLQPIAGGPLLASETPDGLLILDILESAGDCAAAFAYAFLKSGLTMGAARNREEVLGAVLTVIPDVRQPAEISERLQRERANYRSSIKSAIERIDQANQEREAGFEATLSRAKRIASRMLRRRRDSWRNVQRTWQQSASAAVTSIQAVEAAYLESMRLQAPVKYWSDKADAHRKREVWGIGRLIVFFPLALGALAFAFWKSATYLLDHASTGAATPAALYVIITGGLVAFSTLLFWIGRLFTKLYLSEHHLRNDAQERSIMTQTYLALTKESAASDTDRNIILSAIFRTTPDGIVKDEGPADISLQTLLSRLVTK